MKVLKLRHIRIKVDHSLGDLIELLKKLQEEIDDKYRKEVPYVSKLTKDDFPENNLIVKIRLRKQENEQEDKEIVQVCYSYYKTVCINYFTLLVNYF